MAVLPGGLVEIEAGPTGIMLIKRGVFERIMNNHPELKIKNKVKPDSDKSHKFYYNFFDFAFEAGYTWGEDVSFCKLAQKNDFQLFANTESPTAHRGEYAWVGKFGDSLKTIKKDV